MNSQLIPAKLQPLFDYLDELTKRVEIAELRALLGDLDISVDDLRDFARFSDRRYLRNLVRQGKHYHALVLCWRSAQRSPIHDHAGSTCGLRILQGVATETVFERTPSTLINPTESSQLQAGEVSVSADGFIHQVSNLQAPEHDLVTLHVYSPPLLRMATYSLTEPTIGEYRPLILEHSLGSGI